MLKSLYIENYALIDSLNIKFEAGLNVITGETGAGKSIILGALSLILGQRADSRHIKHNEKRSVIEGVFHISDYNLKPFLMNAIGYLMIKNAFCVAKYGPVANLGHLLTTLLYY